MRKTGGSALEVTGVRLPLTGAGSGALIGQSSISPQTLGFNDFVSIANRRGAEIFDDEGSPIGFDVEEDRRLVIQGAGADGGGALAVTVSFDPGVALDPERNHMRPAEGAQMRSFFRTTHGHPIFLKASATSPLDGAERLAPRFSYVRRRREVGLDGAVNYGDAALLLEGDFDVSVVAQTSDVTDATDATFTGAGVLVGDGPTEYLEVPAASQTDMGAAPVLSLRRGPGALETPEAGPTDDVATAGPGLGAPDTASDQMVYAKITAGGAAPMAV